MWHGRYLAGQCDIVNGDCFVAIEFEHVAFFPLLIPLRTWVIVDGSVDTHSESIESFGLIWDGVPIRFSFKALGYAWFRSLLIAGLAIDAFLAFFTVVVWLGGGRPIWNEWIVVSSAIVAWLLWKFSYRFAHASESRAAELREILARKFGQS